MIQGKLFRMDGLRPGHPLAGRSLYGKSGPESWFWRESLGEPVREVLGLSLDRPRFFMAPSCTSDGWDSESPATLGNKTEGQGLPWLDVNHY